MSVDLEVLRRTEAAGGGAPARPRGRLFAVALLAAGALAWGFLLVKDSLFPPRVVSTEAVRVETGPGRATAIVEATGWVEPDPAPVAVRPLVDGIVESVEVVEGDRVVAGETVVARLRSAELEGALEKAEKAYAHTAAHVPEVRAELEQAEALLAQRLDLRREEARLSGEVALSRASVAAAVAEIAVAEQALAGARAELDAQEEIARRGAGLAVPMAKARAGVASAQASLVSRRADRDHAQAALEAAQVQHALAKEALEAPRALEGEVKRVRAHLAAAEADAALMATERDVAAREKGWLVVTSPVSGVVLRREAVPGAVVGPGTMPRGGEGTSADRAMGAVVSLYDPAHLQARVDVLLSNVGGIGAGRRAEVTTDAFPGRVFHGVVARALSQADPAKGTLQVKVRVEDPDPGLKPETIVRARFLADSKPAGGAEAGPSVRVLVPRRAVRGGAVYVFDPQGGGRARRVPVRTLAESGDWVEVDGAVSATHHVILDDGVEDGDRVREAKP